ncbi:MAG: Smr/MutS family protein [Pyrinomonadaceae bacterium]|nr:Smr/MutS family protein [Pyrinomonadaceae bacterium]
MNEEKNIDEESETAEPVVLEITDTFDLHSFQPSEVKAVVNAYLNEVLKKDFKTVRIIHGKGIGVQREIVRNLLSEKDFVKSYKNGDEFSGGGSGATIVQLK